MKTKKTKEETAAYMKEYMRKRIAENREKWNAYWKEYRAKNKQQWQEYNNEYQRQYSKTHPEVRIAMVYNTHNTLGSGVYAIYLGDRCLYVGCSKQLYRRRMEHINNKPSRISAVKDFILEHGRDSVEFRILEICDNTHERETHYIQTLQPELNIQKKTIK
jgi:hypothetical protein